MSTAPDRGQIKVSFTLKVARGVSCTVLRGIYTGISVCPTRRVRYVFVEIGCSSGRRGALQNSSDLDVGRRPELKTDEFCEAPLLLIEI